MQKDLDKEGFIYGLLFGRYYEMIDKQYDENEAWENTLFNLQEMLTLMGFTLTDDKLDTYEKYIEELDKICIRLMNGN
jgi:hypothetical protein